MTDAVYEELYKMKVSLENTLILRENWEDCNPNNFEYSEYVVNTINNELIIAGFCLVQLANSSGEDKTLIHIFALFWLNGDIYRLESYGKTVYDLNSRQTQYISLYCSRIVEWPTYKEDLIKLIDHEPGDAGVSYWNGLFSSNKILDSEFSYMDVELVIVPNLNL